MTALVSIECTGVETAVTHTPFKRVCGHCGRPATRLCDYRAGRGSPCDMLLCDECATAIERYGDHCREHARIRKFRVEMHEKAQEATA